MWRIWVEGEPKGEPRPRMRRQAGFVRVYCPGNPWRKNVRDAAKRLGMMPISGTVSVRAVCFFRRPRRLMRKRDPDGMVLHDSKPDADNVAKAILDGLSGVLYVDDRQVAELVVRKYYSPKLASVGVNSPGAVIEVMPMDESW